MTDETPLDPATYKGRSVAPYGRPGDEPRRILDPDRPWTEAGRSWLAEGERLSAYYARHGSILQRNPLHPPADVWAARERAKACQKVGRDLDRLTALGWVVWHDRRVAGTEMVVDHVLIGPNGVTVFNTLGKSAATTPPGPIAEAAHIERKKLSDVIATQTKQTGQALNL